MKNIQKRTPTLVYLCVLAVMIPVSGLSQTLQNDAQSDIQHEESPNVDVQEAQEGLIDVSVPGEDNNALGVKIFSAQGEINTQSEIFERSFYKGITLYWDVQANKRYAVISTSTTIDTLQRLLINNTSVYRDLYLGENAGIVVTPHKTETVALTIFSPGTLDGTMTVTDLSPDSLSRTSDSVKEKEQVNALDTSGGMSLGQYLVEVYEFSDDHVQPITIPYNDQSELDGRVTIARRVAKEYRVEFDKDQRLYARLTSKDFDTLLEVADNIGRVVISDDWGEKNSLVTLVSPAQKGYYVAVTSFNGLQTGNYTLEVQGTANELVEEKNGQITPSSPKILKKYVSEHILSLQEGEYLTAEVQALDADLEVSFVSDAYESLFSETISNGETKEIPLYAREGGDYKLLMMSELKVISNYILRIYR